MSAAPSHVDVLIVGAGPTGLVLALWLTKLGVRVRIIDKATEPGTTSRALAVQARTLEFYRQVGLADGVVARGRQAIAANIWVTGRKVTRAAFGDMGKGISPYPYVLIYPQDEHERLLIERLAAGGVDVERGTELLDFEESADGTRARVKRADGTVDTCDAAYLAGCDGAHSLVREQLSIGFSGGTYQHLFYVADVQAGGKAMNGELHAGLDRTDFLVVFPMSGEGRARLVGTVRGSAIDQASLSWSDVSTRVMEWLPINVTQVNWFSTYRVHHRVAGQFRHGRSFLLGDAAHIHSPVGGQGMNTGIGDAVNLAWKLAAVLRRAAAPAILDTYEAERGAFAQRLVATTDQAFTAVTSSSLLARTVRLRLLPMLIPPLFSFPATRRLMYRTISQTDLNYRGSALSEGSTGAIQGGDRLPWVQTGGHGDDNFAPLRTLDWQVHVYGEATSELQSECRRRRLSMEVFEWQPAMGLKSLRRNALYLVRPDGYVAVTNEDGRATALSSYLDARSIKPRDIADLARSPR